MKKQFVTFFRQLFCTHKFQLTYPGEIFPSPEPGETLSFSREHICHKCDKNRVIGSGIHHG